MSLLRQHVFVLVEITRKSYRIVSSDIISYTYKLEVH